MVDRAVLAPVAHMLADAIVRKGLNTFAPPHPGVTGYDESIVATSTEHHLALRASRVWDESQRTHELRFELLGARV